MKSAWVRCVLAACVLMGGSSCQAVLVFAINEGVTYKVSNDQIRARYTALAGDLSKLLNDTVTVEPVAEYPRLRKGLAEQKYDLAMVHPAHLSIVAIKHNGYRLLVVTKGFEKYTANFLVNKDSPLKSLADLKGLRLGAPDEDSITSWMVRATIRDKLQTADAVRYAYTRYQDAVPFFVENRLTAAGATASGAVIKAWEAKGGKILAKSRPVPIKHVLAGPRLSPEQVTKVRDYLLALDSSEAGQKKLEPTKYKGFMAYDQAELLRIGTWLGL
jgi:ABC-type phosphate/phosphonate transport system substrate-binding protein